MPAIFRIQPQLGVYPYLHFKLKDCTLFDGYEQDRYDHSENKTAFRNSRRVEGDCCARHRGISFYGMGVHRLQHELYRTWFFSRGFLFLPFGICYRICL